MGSNNWRDTLYFGFLTLSLISMLLIDLSGFYPKSLLAQGAPLHFLHQLRQWYATTYNDPWIGSEETQPSWFKLFTLLELVFQLPVLLYILAKYSACRQGTTGELELAALVYGVQCALTTLVCMYDIPTWDTDVYSPADKNMFMFQLYGPWFFIPAAMSLDMYWRLLERVKGTDNIKKMQ